MSVNLGFSFAQRFADFLELLSGYLIVFLQKLEEIDSIVPFIPLVIGIILTVIYFEAHWFAPSGMAGTLIGSLFETELFGASLHQPNSFVYISG